MKQGKFQIITAPLKITKAQKCHVP